MMHTRQHLDKSQHRGLENLKSGRLVLSKEGIWNTNKIINVQRDRLHLLHNTSDSLHRVGALLSHSPSLQVS